MPSLAAFRGGLENALRLLPPNVSVCATPVLLALLLGGCGCGVRLSNSSAEALRGCASRGDGTSIKFSGDVSLSSSALSFSL